MRWIALLIIHCSAVMPSQQSSALQIDAWHRQLGWNGIGYHYVIRRDGTVETGRGESLVGAHCRGHNQHSIGICYEGGLDEKGHPCDTRTAEQKAAILTLLKDLKTRYPHAEITDHHHLNPAKACPCFDAVTEYSQL